MTWSGSLALNCTPAGPSSMGIMKDMILEHGNSVGVCSLHICSDSMLRFSLMLPVLHVFGKICRKHFRYVIQKCESLIYHLERTNSDDIPNGTNLDNATLRLTLDIISMVYFYLAQTCVCNASPHDALIGYAS